MCRLLLMEGVARAVAAEVMALVGECFREDEQDALYAAIYEEVLEGLQLYERQSGRLSRILSEN
jgi:hypothetical protein